MGRLRIMALTLLLAAPASAGTDEAVFDLMLRGMRAGTLSFSAEEQDGRYAVNGRLESGGLIGMFRTTRYDVAARGSIQGRTPAAATYSERAARGDDRRETILTWTNGVPAVERSVPQRKRRSYDIEAQEQRGTVDPLSALYAALRDTAPGEECRLSLDIFDGRRLTRVALGEPTPSETGVTCKGEFRRVAGYSKEDLAEKSRFPFVVSFAPTDEGRMRAVRVTADTIYGQATLRRR
ncbi:DUF3108 domain-containing protein [Cereibacter sphaeroides]|uniref:DUF3108 domain-containing protein n=1 Tax=Cereibacter sphaeroides TaxID=1063 RepID=UPI001F2F9A7B|nr:DUF3108 domain-containing protein [Cereibacter sphaeroides]MCE6967666.1 DUF3108 domain-containing protein [Cereibacter sphaeroides]